MDLLANLLVAAALEVCGTNCVLADLNRFDNYPQVTLPQVVDSTYSPTHCTNEDTPYESL